MTTIPAPFSPQSREEWPDADFDLPDGSYIRSLVVESDKEEDDDNYMDWDTEMDLERTGGAKAKAVVCGLVSRNEFPRLSSGGMITIRPPLPCQEEEEEEDEEGVSTIKVTVLPKPPVAKPLPASIEEDFESAFAFPSDLTQLSLAPLPLSHRSSKNSFEWGDKDQTSSSQSSDAYSTLSFADASSSNSATSASLPETEESACEDDESELDGLVIPSGLFESGQSGKHLKKLLEMKRKVQVTEQRVKPTSPDPEDDFEIGLVIEDDADFNPSKLVSLKHSNYPATRSKTVPVRIPPPARPPSRLRANRAKSPVNPPVSSTRQLQRIKLSSSPPPQPTSRIYKETFATSTLLTNNFLSPKPTTLRGQKSHSGLKPPTPPIQRRLVPRKASLSSLMEAGSSQVICSGTTSTAGPIPGKSARYEAPTAASRARSHTNSTSRIHGLDFTVPPPRPSTPSSNSAVSRLTMPTSLRVKSRPSLTSVFPGSSTNPVNPPAQPVHRAPSPIPPRPPSTSSLRKGAVAAQIPSIIPSIAPKLLRRPKRQRTYGDGTELDGFDDLPTDREKEYKFRVQPKAPSRNGANSAPKLNEKDKGTLRKKGRKDGLGPTSGWCHPAYSTLL